MPIAFSAATNAATRTATTIFENPLVMAPALGWLTAQVIKFILYVIVNHEFRWERLVGDGGMPSCHSATVSALAVEAGLVCGVGSPIFGLALFLAIIVMHDAMGVRRETGKQAVFIEQLMEAVKLIEDISVKFSDEKLKRFVGHTPFQVYIGSGLGILVAVGYYFIFVA